MISAPTITIQIGGLPPVVCARPLRAEGRVPRFDVISEGHYGLTQGMLRDWFETQGLGNIGSGEALRICAKAADALA